MTDFSSSFGVDGGAGDRPVPLHPVPLHHPSAKDALAHPSCQAPPPPQGEEHAPRFGRGWVPASRDIGIPGEQAGASSPSGATERVREREGDGPRIFSSSPESHTAWDADRKVRFLDQLSQKGDVRSACAFVGMSRTSAYLLRRRDAVFADAWTAALVLARRHVEEVLATRALDGVEEAVWFRGELVGVRRRYDSRLLLAHLARLDVAGEGLEALAERFDEVLALVAGEEPCADVPGMEEGAALPPERADYVAAAGEARFGDAREAWLDAVDAIDAAAGYVQPLGYDEVSAGDAGEAPDYPEAPVRGPFLRESGAQWDRWQARAFARVDRALSGGEGAAPMEYKSLEAKMEVSGGVAALDRVNRVNLLAPRRWGSTAGQKCSEAGNACPASLLSSVKAGAALPPPPPSCAGRPFSFRSGGGAIHPSTSSG
ncbi:hypothetical protein BV97_00792 [Novosphingobium resinovorum]|uniref:Uncharacterized protein n=1 Tax=Novosphingobium resinovorum TaxID=158500 RepID=A0A031K4S6_9SPHN|nr:hypothetical protein [Novosphingobium resinovorum]EZP83607.1 hypothetical protein BV97_00792 [Novosphingobium resinovorum]